MKKRKIILIILLVTLLALFFAYVLPSEYFLTVIIDEGVYVPSGKALQIIFSLQYINMILIIVFGYLIYTKDKK